MRLWSHNGRNRWWSTLRQLGASLLAFPILRLVPSVLSDSDRQQVPEGDELAMAPWRQLQTATREGSLAAQRACRRLGLSLERRVDVFSVIEAEGIWLMFQPLRNLFGFYRRFGEVAGIVINANHPASLQRYTAAHEYGHHILGHGFSLRPPEVAEGYAR